MKRADLNGAKALILEHLRSNSEDGWVTLGQVELAIDKAAETLEGQNGTLIVGWRAIGDALGRNGQSLAVRASYGTLPLMPGRHGRQPAYTQEQIEQLRAMLDCGSPGRPEKVNNDNEGGAPGKGGVPTLAQA